VHTTVVCSCRYIGDFFVAPNLFFSDTLLDPVPPPIYARCPTVLASPPRFPTGRGTGGGCRQIWGLGCRQPQLGPARGSMMQTMVVEN